MDKTSSTIKPVRIFGPSHAPVEFEDVTSGDRDILSAKVTNCEMNRIERETWMTEIKHKFNESKIGNRILLIFFNSSFRSFEYQSKIFYST